jgi:hypothetical protein
MPPTGFVRSSKEMGSGKDMENDADAVYSIFYLDSKAATITQFSSE